MLKVFADRQAKNCVPRSFDTGAKKKYSIAGITSKIHLDKFGIFSKFVQDERQRAFNLKASSGTTF
jgi:hypothetical protein